MDYIINPDHLHAGRSQIENTVWQKKRQNLTAQTLTTYMFAV